MAMNLLQTHQNEPEPLFICHPGEVSNVRGQKNSNIQRLRDLVGLKVILVQGRENILRGSLMLKTKTREASIHRGSFA
jgi:hypothetical protein